MRPPSTERSTRDPPTASTNGHVNGASIPPANGSSTSNGISNGVTSTLAYPDSDINRNELVRIMIQSLEDMGFNQAAQALVDESGVELEPDGVIALRSAIVRGDWPQADQLLTALHTGSTDLRGMKFLLGQQKYLELLEGGHTKRALAVLRNELAPLQHDADRLHLLSSLMMCADVDDLRRRAGWDGAGGSSRQELLRKLQDFIPATIMLPSRRLHTLLEQAKSLQKLLCTYHTIDRPISLLTDHVCDRSTFPNITTHILAEHKDEVWALAFSHDGKSLATASKDFTAIIWQNDFAPIRMLAEHTDGISCLAWSPDDKYLLTGAELCIKLWDVAAGKCVLTMAKHEYSIGSLAWMPDGKSFMSAGMDAKVIFWDLDGRILFTWKSGTSRLIDATLTPDGTRVIAVGTSVPPTNGSSHHHSSSSATANGRDGDGKRDNVPPADERKLHIYNVRERRQEREIISAKELTCVSVSDDSKYALVNVSPNEVCIYEISSGRLERRFIGQKQGNHIIRSCFGGQTQNFVFSGSEDAQIYVWHRETASLIDVLSGHEEGSVNSVAWNPGDSSMLASASDDHTVRIWQGVGITANVTSR